MTIPIFEAKARLAQVIHQAQEGEFVSLTRHGKPAAVILSQDNYQELQMKGSSLLASLAAWRSRWKPETDEDPFGGIRGAEEGRAVDMGVSE